MKRVLIPLIAFAFLASAACNQANQTTASPSGSAFGSAAPSASARATGSVAASASASAGATSKYIDLKVVAPEDNARAGVDGMGWTVDVIAKGNGPAMEKIKPAFQQSTSPGKNTAFPGLVVLLKSSSSSTSNASSSPGTTSSNAQQNLAKLFQVIGLPNTRGGVAGISSVTASPAATGGTSASGASASPAGTAATRSTTSQDNETAEATWFVQQNQWGSDADVELTVFVVEGDAPDTVSDRSSLKIVSNEVTVRFHINGGSAAPAGSARPSATGSPAGSPAGSASPSKSP